MAHASCARLIRAMTVSGIPMDVDACAAETGTIAEVAGGGGGATETAGGEVAGGAGAAETGTIAEVAGGATEAAGGAGATGAGATGAGATTPGNVKSIMLNTEY